MKINRNEKEKKKDRVKRYSLHRREWRLFFTQRRKILGFCIRDGMQLTLTWGWKDEERKAQTEREGKMERRLERDDRRHSAGRKRLWWGVNSLSVWKRRGHNKPRGRCGTHIIWRCALQYTRTTGVTAITTKTTMNVWNTLWERTRRQLQHKLSNRMDECRRTKLI